MTAPASSCFAHGLIAHFRTYQVSRHQIVHSKRPKIGTDRTPEMYGPGKPGWPGEACWLTMFGQDPSAPSKMDQNDVHGRLL